MEIKRHIEVDKSIEEILNDFNKEKGNVDANALEDEMSLPVQLKGDRPSLDEIKPGDTFTVIATIMGMANTLELTVQESSNKAEVLANKYGHYKMTGTGMAGVEITTIMDLDGRSGDKTILDLDTQIEGQMLVGAIGVAVEKAVEDEETSIMEKLKTRFPVMGEARISKPEAA